MAYNIEETQDIPYAAWLDSIPGFGRSRCYQLVETAGSARNAYEMPDSDIAFLLGAKALAVWQQHRKLKEPNALYETYLHQGISYVYYKARSIHRSCEIFQIRLLVSIIKEAFLILHILR